MTNGTEGEPRVQSEMESGIELSPEENQEFESASKSVFNEMKKIESSLKEGEHLEGIVLDVRVKDPDSGRIALERRRYETSMTAGVELTARHERRGEKEWVLYVSQRLRIGANGYNFKRVHGNLIFWQSGKLSSKDNMGEYVDVDEYDKELALNELKYAQEALESKKVEVIVRRPL